MATSLDKAAILAFLRDLLDPERYGHAVTPEVRARARELLEQAEAA